MNTPPFVANHEDNMHCLLACYRMLTQYFWRRDMSWQQAEAFTGFREGRVPWTIRSLVQFHRMGLDIKMIEPFDYKRYNNEKEVYLKAVFSPAQLKWFTENSSPDEVLPYLDEFYERVDFTSTQPTLADIDSMLSEGRLVTVTVNSGALNSKSGYVSHVLLIYGKEGSDYLAHDPGPPPYPERRLPSETLLSAMGDVASVTGSKLDEKRGVRLDHWVTGIYPLLSRAYAGKIIASGKVTVNGEVETKAGHKLRRGDAVVVDYDPSELLEIPDIELPILYEDDDCVVIDKPAGILTHSVGDYTAEGTVATWLRKKQHELKGARGGIVHRLDRVTSGVMICAKTPEALKWLQKQFAERAVKKAYLAVVKGAMTPAAAIIDMPIERNPKAPATFRVGAQGKAARTTYETVATNGVYSLLKLTPETGRTHQLRVHLAQQGHPIVGDVLYGGEPAERLYLHAVSLEILLPGREEKMRFEAKVPKTIGEKVSQ